jgi:phage baseplate assembly protein W
MAEESVPHLAVPFTITKQGVETVEQDSVEEIAGCVYNICVCPQGFRGDQPSFGRPPVEFGSVPLNLAPLEAAIEEWEPRADLTITDQAEAMNAALRDVTIEVS